MYLGIKRIEQIVLICSFIGFCWLAMQATHELGHVLGALFTGGKVSKVVLHPFAISHTFLSHNPMPIFVVWAGPIIGVLVPLLAFLMAKACGIPGLYLFRFFAGFCLVSNGAYIGLGSFRGLADAGDMLRYGSSRWSLIFFGIISSMLGFYLWNGLGPKFGLGKANGMVSRFATVASLVCFVLIFATELAIGSR